MLSLKHLQRLCKIQSLAHPVRYSLPSITAARNFSKTNPNHNVDKVYELRIYSIHPSKVGKFMALTKDQFHLRTNHSKLYGYWTTELGGLGEVVHIWEYDNFAHRTNVRKALSEDPVWLSSYISRMTKMIVKQDNTVVQAVPWHPVHDTPLAEGGVYELRFYSFKPARDNAWLDSVRKAVEVRIEQYDKIQPGVCKIMGVWFSDVGQLNMVYTLWNWKSLDNRRESRQIVNSTEEVRAASLDLWKNVVQMNNKILLPASFSTLK